MLITSIPNTLIKKRREIKMVLHGDAIVMLIENTCIVFNNNKFNSLHRYDIPQNDRIVHRVVQRLFQHNLKISHRRHV
jgi:hypothetical protein